MTDTGPVPTMTGRADRADARHTAWLDPVLLLLPAAVVAAGFLSIYVARRYAMPLGYDTGKYVWRANLVAARGLDGLSSVPILHPNADRPGFPILAGLVHGTLGITPLRLSFLVVGVVPAVIGLAAGALAVTAFEQPRWSFPVYAVVVGGSVNVSIMAVSHLDTLLVSGVVLAAAAAVLDAADGRRTAAAAVILLVGGALVHWNFVAVFGAVVAVFGLALLPESARARRAGTRTLATPTGRVGTILVAAGALGVAALVGLTPAGPQPPPPSRSMFLDRLRGVLPSYRLLFVVPVALGGAALLREGSARRRRSLWFALLWCASALAAAALLYAGLPVAAHRIVGFALALPFLAAAALVGVAGRAWRTGRAPIRAVGTAVLVLGVAVGAFVTLRDWYDNAPSMSAKAFGYATTAGAYLDRYAPGRPVVLLFETTPGGVVVGVRTFRAAAPPDRIAQVGAYLGDVTELLAGRPTTRPGDAAFNTASLGTWRAVRPVLARDPVILTNPAFDTAFPALLAQHPDWLVAPGLMVVSGPRPAGIQAAAIPGPISGWFLLLGGLAVLALLGAAGVGWAWSLVPSGWFERCALAPAFGVATLVLGGAVADAAGVRLAGPVAWLVVAGVALAGWGPAVLRRRRRAPQVRPAAAGSAEG